MIALLFLFVLYYKSFYFTDFRLENVKRVFGYMMGRIDFGVALSWLRIDSVEMILVKTDSD